eukprot:715759-Amphidinium_carterae.2
MDPKNEPMFFDTHGASARSTCPNIWLKLWEGLPRQSKGVLELHREQSKRKGCLVLSDNIAHHCIR